MPYLRSSKGGKNHEDLVSPIKAGKVVKKKVSNTTKVNIPQHDPSTSGHLNVSAASLPSLQTPPGFGSLSQVPLPLTIYSK